MITVKQLMKQLRKYNENLPVNIAIPTKENVDYYSIQSVGVFQTELSDKLFVTMDNREEFYFEEHDVNNDDD